MVTGSDVYGDSWEVGISYCEKFIFMNVTEDDTKMSHSYTENEARTLAAALIEKADDVKRLRAAKGVT